MALVAVVAALALPVSSAWRGGEASAAILERETASASLPAPPCTFTTSTRPATKPSGLIALTSIRSAAQVPETSRGPAKVFPDALFLNSAVDGVQLYVRWAALEPQENEFNPAVLGAVDEVLCQADEHHKFVVLDVLPGFATPEWAEQDTSPQKPQCAKPAYQSYSTYSYCFQYSYSGNAPATALPVPWNATYLGYWFGLLSVIEDRYGSNSQFVMIAADGPTSVSEEMSLPNCPSTTAVPTSCKNGPDEALPKYVESDSTPPAKIAINESDINMWEALGYTPQTYEAAWQSVFAQYERDFPRQYVSFSLFSGLPIAQAGSSCDAQCQETTSTDSTLDTVVGEGAKTVVFPNSASRFAFQGDGLTARDDSQNFRYVEQVHQDDTTAATGYQTTNPAKFPAIPIPPGDNGLEAPGLALEDALKNGFNAGANYVEFYASDVYDKNGTENPATACALNYDCSLTPRPPKPNCHGTACM